MLICFLARLALCHEIKFPLHPRLFRFSSSRRLGYTPPRRYYVHPVRDGRASVSFRGLPRVSPRFQDAEISRGFGGENFAVKFVERKYLQVYFRTIKEPLLLCAPFIFCSKYISIYLLIFLIKKRDL
ncbi:hypothetical protein PUN28_015941 [Cardiocondyla obscurior]|uniref:Uncharacterized protein n=1 Tax=Cardiocondyla obscurior TaxID=286306 RepID=A0AAW2EQ69_9HYME